MCTVLLPPGGNPIAVNKYIISYLLILKRKQPYPPVKNMCALPAYIRGTPNSVCSTYNKISLDLVNSSTDGNCC